MDTWKRLIGLVATYLLVWALPCHAEQVLLAQGGQTVWRYLDDGSTPKPDWTRNDFDDSAWKQGPAPLGYGEPLLGSKLSFGDNASAKHVTCYFRTELKVAVDDRQKLSDLGIVMRQDDGAIVYLNGEEAIRVNLPPGPVKSTTLAVAALGGRDETAFRTFIVPATLLAKQGRDVVAVEVHQAHPGSSDLYLDLEIKGYRSGEAPKPDVYRAGMAAVARGDYEQAAKWLSQLDPDHPDYVQVMAFLAFRIYGQALGRAAEGLPFAHKAYELEPDDRNVVRAYIKTHVLAGVLFDDDAIARERPATVAADHAFLVSKPPFRDDSPRFTRKQLEGDLDYLEHVLANCFAYLELRPVDYRGALDAIRISLDEEMPVNSFELCLAKLISLFGDGHARMHHHPAEFLPPGYAPYLAGTYQGRVYLLNGKGDDFLDADHPYVTHIDGRSIDDWLKVAGYIVVKQSPQWHRRHSLENLAYVTYIRSELGLPRKPEIKLRLESTDRRRTQDVIVRLRLRRYGPLPFPRGASRRIGDVGYLRIPRMTSSPRFLAELDRRMESFRDTKGLIIDVRGNQGGTKHVLFTLFPYFMQPDAPLKAVEFSTYRMPMLLPKPNLGGFMMSYMSAQVVTSPRWETEADRERAKELVRAFRPQWRLPEEEFSPWHVLALDSRTNPNAYYYDKPLIVLHDSGTFSAGDIFVGALEDHPQTTRMGMSTGGGNGWMESYVLPNTGLGLVLCQSAKFRPNGEPYDGRGIPPQITLEATPQDVMGKDDSVLRAAVERLSNSD